MCWESRFSNVDGLTAWFSCVCDPFGLFPSPSSFHRLPSTLGNRCYCHLHRRHRGQRRRPRPDSQRPIRCSLWPRTIRLAHSLSRLHLPPPLPQPRVVLRREQHRAASQVLKRDIISIDRLPSQHPRPRRPPILSRLQPVLKRRRSPPPRPRPRSPRRLSTQTLQISRPRIFSDSLPSSSIASPPPTTGSIMLPKPPSPIHPRTPSPQPIPGPIHSTIMPRSIHRHPHHPIHRYTSR